MNGRHDGLIDRLAQQKVVFEKITEENSSRLSPHSVHVLRVCIRRVRAILWIFKHSSPRLHDRDLDEKLRELGKLLGAVRELDVAIEDAKKYGISDSSLKKKRKRHEKLLKERFQRARGKKIFSLLTDFMHSVQAAQKCDSRQAERAIHERLESWRDKPLKSDKKLHRFRITIKKTRYAYEAMGKPAKEFRKLQSVLGRAHDLQVLQNLLGKNRNVAKKQVELKKRAIKLAKNLELQ